MLKPAELSSLIADIYDCALEPKLWPAVLQRISKAIGAVYGSVRVMDPRSKELRLNVTHGGSAEWNRLYETTYYKLVPTLHAQLGMDLDDAQNTGRMMSRVEFDQSRFYREWAKPQGFEDVIGVMFIKRADRIAWSSYYLPQRLKLQSSPEYDIVNLLSPHFRRAALISDLLEMQSIEAEHFRNVVDHLAIGVLMVDADCGLLDANPAGQAMLDADAPLCLRGGKVRGAQATVTAAITRLVEAMGRSGTGLSNGGSSVPVSYADGRPGLIHILPQRTSSPRRRLHAQAAAVVFLTPQTADLPTLAETMAALYDLSPAEKRVLALLVEGHSPGVIATRLGLGEATVRSHLRALFAKTATSKQSELVALTKDMSLPVRM